MKEENYLEGIYGCLERIEKKVETLPVEGTSPAVGNRTSSPEGIAELKIRLERLQSAVEKNGLEIAAVRNHTVRLSEGWPLSAETFAGEMEKIRYCLSQDCQAVKETVRRLDERMVLLKKEPERRLVTYRLESASKAVVTTASALILALVVSVWTNCNQYRTNHINTQHLAGSVLTGNCTCQSKHHRLCTAQSWGSFLVQQFSENSLTHTHFLPFFSVTFLPSRF